MKKLLPVISIALLLVMIYMIYTSWHKIRQTEFLNSLLGPADEIAGPPTHSQAESCKYRKADGTFIDCSELCDSTETVQCINPPCANKRVPCDHPNAIPKY